MGKRTEEDEYKEFIAKRRLGELTNEDDIKIIRRIFDTQSLNTCLDPLLMLTSLEGEAAHDHISDAQVLQTRFLATIVEQNFIMIRQLERISRAVGGETEKQLSKAEEYLRKKQEAVNEEQAKEDQDVVIHMDPEKTMSKMEAYLRNKQAAVRKENNT